MTWTGHLVAIKVMNSGDGYRRGLLPSLSRDVGTIQARYSCADRFQRSRVIDPCGAGYDREPTSMLPERNGFALPFAASFVALALIAGTIGASAQPKPGGAPGGNQVAHRLRRWLGPPHPRWPGLPRPRSIPLPRRSGRLWPRVRCRISPHLRDRHHRTSPRRDRASSVRLRCHGLLPSPRARRRASPNRSAQAHRPP